MIEFTEDDLSLLYETCSSMRDLCTHLGANGKADEYQYILDKLDVELKEKEYINNLRESLMNGILGGKKNAL